MQYEVAISTQKALSSGGWVLESIVLDWVGAVRDNEGPI